MIFEREMLFDGTVLPNNTLFGGTVLPNSSLFGQKPNLGKHLLFREKVRFYNIYNFSSIEGKHFSHG